VDQLARRLTVLQLAIAGLAAGVAYSALAACLVLVHQVSEVINVSQGIVGGIGAYVVLVLHHHDIGLPVAVVAGVAVGAIASALIGLIFAAGFAEADVNTKTAASIALTIALLAVAQRVFGRDPELFPVLLRGRVVEIGSVVIAWVNLIGAGALVAIGLGLHVGTRRTRIGVRMWAVSVRPRTAELLGVRRRAITAAVWALAGAIATAGLLVVTPTRQSDLGAMTMLVVPGLAAAMIGSLRSIPLALAAGVAIGMCESLLLHWPSVAQYRQALSFAVIVIVLLASQWRAVWDEAR
jgi:branched-chain amino acid transport system permease protein